MATTIKEKNKTLSILIVEDEAVSALWMKSELERDDYAHCHLVATGEAAINSVRNNRPDIILMDIKLAGEISGAEAAVTIANDPTIGIIVVSGYLDDQAREQLEPIPQLMTLTKPVGINEIKEGISRLRKQ